MIFKSRQVNLDELPYVWPSGVRSMFTSGLSATEGYIDLKYDPRPEFEPTRDPEPWRESHPQLTPGWVHERRSSHPRKGFVWAPRVRVAGSDNDLAFDTPVNPILSSFRRSLAANSPWLTALAAHIHMTGPITDDHSTHGSVTQEMLDHARKVLTRLANLSNG